MRNRILGAIGVLWGGAALVRWFSDSGSHGSGAYAAGYTAGSLIFGGLFFLVGAYYLLTGGSKKS
jgi:hypothetical protein